MKSKPSVLKNLRDVRVNLEKANQDVPLTQVPVPAAVILDDVIKALCLSDFERSYILGGKTIKEIDAFWTRMNMGEG